jgi:hypothetical protein
VKFSRKMLSDNTILTDNMLSGNMLSDNIIFSTLNYMLSDNKLKVIWNMLSAHNTLLTDNML